LSLHGRTERMISALVAQSAPPPPSIGDPPSAWLPVVLLMVIGILFAVGNIIASGLIGPGRTGPGRSATYESGMMPVGDTRRRFNVPFYIVAIIFLVIELEIVFFYPWAMIFPRYAAIPALHARSGVLLLQLIVFVAILLVAYLYAWLKGVFRWD